MNDDFTTKSIYLEKKGETGYLGLHSTGTVGYDGEWYSMEAWINVYDLDRKFQYSASRIFGPIEDESRMFQQEGLKVISDWKD